MREARKVSGRPLKPQIKFPVVRGDVVGGFFIIFFMVGNGSE